MGEDELVGMETTLELPIVEDELDIVAPDDEVVRVEEKFLPGDLVDKVDTDGEFASAEMMVVSLGGSLEGVSDVGRGDGGASVAIEAAGDVVEVVRAGVFEVSGGGVCTEVVVILRRERTVTAVSPPHHSDLGTSPNSTRPIQCPLPLVPAVALLSGRPTGGMKTCRVRALNTTKIEVGSGAWKDSFPLQQRTSRSLVFMIMISKRVHDKELIAAETVIDRDEKRRKVV
ncbi:hypothetical protein FB45DRAFT_869244 [Roridomyces roridus]|uniref:Uncharacterized protein n=1 Tax=Roridomyces roridus TaxID=1738132 RepID=A0AAD7BNS7_9AGAR|nr:hypothetical protein FB45DRAFT_869244 [Roridomyces roridus]